MLERRLSALRGDSGIVLRWLAGDPLLRLLPMTDDRVETHVTIADPDVPGAAASGALPGVLGAVHAEPDALAITLVGIEAARPAPGCWTRSSAAELDLGRAEQSGGVDRSDPRRAGDLRGALRHASAPVVGFSGILGGAPVLGMAHRLLPAIGVERRRRRGRPALRRAVAGRGARRLGDGRRRQGIGRGWSAEGGLQVVVTDLIMRDPRRTAAFVARAVQAVA